MGGRAAAAVGLKLLLDEMHSFVVAEQLRDRGFDVVAVKERPDLIGMPDEDLLAAASGERRVLVTENVKDFAAISRRWTTAGRMHTGLVFTHPQRFPRSARNHVRVLAGSLERFVANDAKSLVSVQSFLWWLDPKVDPSHDS